ncbi:hypothetical protein HU200_034822 [Digitaria exilis]|uniref:GDSL esterase/lipase n=1 Tax=Digitaria exilis TaxID=1010633 RepID=A0A835ENI8_9POAL|nr:hypothetical protein HU200_034822 [Digitaria exilis]
MAAESRRHRHNHHNHGGDDDSNKRATHKLFVFGDDYADTGNGVSDPELGYKSRQWRPPFGMSDAAHAKQPSGRFSDGLVQPDYLAKIMGHRESPPPYTYDDWADGIDDAGLNFAVGGSVVLRTAATPKLGDQVQQLRSLIRDDTVTRGDLNGSVALIAISGNDYSSATAETFEAMMDTVVDGIADAASRLLDMGVAKVLVNTLQPLGCTPWQTRGFSNYTSCNGDGNAGCDRHNAALRDRLAGDGDVMLLDVNTIVMDLVAPRPGSALDQGRFEEELRLRPCCEATDPDAGYCGLDGGYSLCDHPEDYFFWDDAHLTQAGWRAVMQLLQGPIMSFLGISNLQHF